MQFILVAGVPRAGKSSFADWVVEHDERFAHIPLDRYILPLPTGAAGPKENAAAAFVAWVREPSCIDWDLLAQHVAMLAAGDDCRTPKSDWSKNGVRLSMGGRDDAGPGRLMPADRMYYLVVGTHAYGFAGRVLDAKASKHLVKVFIDTPEATVAERLHGGPLPAAGVAGTIRRCLADNCVPLLAQRSQADLLLSGVAQRRQQYEGLVDLLGVESALAGDSALDEAEVGDKAQSKRIGRGERRRESIEKRRRNREKARQERHEDS